MTASPAPGPEHRGPARGQESIADAPPIRRPIHRGSVLAAGLFIDARSTGEAPARERLMRAMGAGARVARSGDRIIVCLREPVRMSASASPAGLLVRHGEVLSSAPLEKDELACLNTVGPAAVIVAGGAPVVIPLDGAHREDAASWIDVSDFEIAADTTPLGSEQTAPKAGVEGRDVDVRASLGVEAAPEELARVRRALLGFGGGEEGQSTGGPGDGRESAWGRLAARFFAGLAWLVDRVFPGSLAGRAGGGTAMARSRPAKALAVHEDPRPAGQSWLSALSRGLQSLALRMLVWSRLAGVVGRRQAEYLSRMLDMFERGDLDGALRHAIPLGDGAGGEPAPPALRTPSPRSELTITPARAPASSALYSGPNLFEELRRRYRRAFEQLERAGEVEKAAFVLAELLGAHEEAVSFLEKHGRLRLAAEIAAARGLPPGLVVRQWFLAGDARRAVRLARVTGAFADAVHRLEASGRAGEAESLRLAWADALADAGQLGAAVQVIWPVVPARGLAEAWLDRAIAIGGPLAAQMVLRKGRLFPESYPATCDRVLALLREPGEEGETIARALAVEIGAFADDPSSRVLAAPVLRALLRGAAPAGEEGAHRALVERMADVSGDALLREEVRMLWKKRPAQGGAPQVTVAAAGMTRADGRRTVNEDSLFVARLSPADPPGSGLPLRGDVAKNGVALGVLDGMGGNAAGDIASQLAGAVITGHLQQVFGRAEGASAWADALREAAVLAGRAVHERAMSDVRARGCGSTVAVATVAGGTLIVAHVGDCRAYLLRGGELAALTRDHSLENEYMKLRGEPPPEEIPKNIVTRALGMAPVVEVDVATAPLCDGDVLCLCTNGVWGIVPEGRLAAILSRNEPPEALCAAIEAACAAAGADDDQTAVVARFTGKRLKRAGGAPVVAEPFAVREAVTVAPLGKVAEPKLIRRDAADVGALAIHDVAELPDGRLLVALGELGAWLLSREGRVLVRFAEPAEDIVMSDGGDRALLLAKRGEARRITRLDLVGRRKQPWCDARIQVFAPDFDGSVWYVANQNTLYAIDATQSGWEHLWQVSEPDANIVALARDERRLSAALVVGATEQIQVWTWELPSHRLRGRDVLGKDGTSVDVSLSPSGELVALNPWPEEEPCVLLLRKQGREVPLPSCSPDGQRRLALSEAWLATPGGEGGAGLELLDTDLARPRLRVELAGGRAGGRIRGDHLLVFDERGRLLVISLRTGRVIREMRLS